MRLSYRSQVPGQEAEQRVNASYQRLTFKERDRERHLTFSAAAPSWRPGPHRLSVLMSWMVVQ